MALTARDESIFQQTSLPFKSPRVFQSSENLYVLDSNGGSYSSNQIFYDTSTLASNGKWMSLSEAYFEIPLVYALKASVDISSVPPNPFAVGNKSGYWNFIDSIQVDFNGSNVVQQTPFTNIFSNFKCLATWSQDDVAKYGASCGFFKDDPQSFQYTPSASVYGLGVCNNLTYGQFYSQASTGYQGPAFNDGFLKRLRTTGYYSAQGATGSLGNLYTFQTSPQSIGLPYFSTSGSGASRVYYWSLLATIRLKDLSDFFDKAGLVRGALLRITLNMNTSQQTITIGGTASVPTMTISSASNITVSGRTNPLMIATCATGSPLALPAAYCTGAAATFSVGCGVGQVTVSGSTVSNGILSNSTRLYIPCYTMDPEMEREFLQSHPRRSIEYYDLYSYTVSGITAGSSFNALLTNGLVNPKFLVVAPQLNIASNGPGYFNEIQSPFSSAPATTCPLSAIQNFQVQIAGLNVFQTQEQYLFDQFLSELSNTGITGGAETGLCSGQLSQTDFGYAYSYFVADISRRLSADNVNAPKSVLIQGINSSAVTVDYVCFIAYTRSITIDTRTSELL